MNLNYDEGADLDALTAMIPKTWLDAMRDRCNSQRKLAERKRLEMALAAGWIVLLAIFLVSIRSCLVLAVVAPLIVLSRFLDANSWLVDLTGIYLVLWLIGKWLIKYA